jgi:hypothetical protein
MTFASSVHDAIQTAERIAEDIQGRVQEIELLKAQLDAAQKQVDLDMLLADLSMFLSKIPTTNFSQGLRAQREGLRKRLNDVRAA